MGREYNGARKRYISAMKQLVSFVQGELSKVADKGKAKGMAAYMKTSMPFYGVQKPHRAAIQKAIRLQFNPQTRGEYVEAVESLWKLPHREEKYIAVAVAQMFPQFISIGSNPFYRRLIIEGAWWDFVDDLAIRLVGRVLLNDRERAGRTIDRWIDDPNLWIRRSAIICQIGHKKSTDERRLFDTCLRRAGEKEFFIRKAIGWALRDYAGTNPAAIKSFLRKHGSLLSPLSQREAAKNLGAPTSK